MSRQLVIQMPVQWPTKPQPETAADAIVFLHRAVLHLRQQFRVTMTRDEAQAAIDARALLIKCGLSVAPPMPVLVHHPPKDADKERAMRALANRRAFEKIDRMVEQFHHPESRRRPRSRVYVNVVQPEKEQ